MRYFLKQFCGYFVVGGASAIVEWSSFFIFNKILLTNYIIATIFSFLIATFVNWILGKLTVFKLRKRNDNRLKEVGYIYLVSAIGLIGNITFMWILVSHFNLEPMISKIAATGIVFTWNFLIREYFIYK